jgi:HTH-type transcriptional regulator, cell division transcriptional repressor
MLRVKNIVGKQVKLARNKCNPRLTQAELAAKLQVEGWDIDRGGVAKIEAGIRQVTDVEVVRLAKALQISVSWLLGETE